MDRNLRQALLREAIIEGIISAIFALAMVASLLGGWSIGEQIFSLLVVAGALVGTIIIWFVAASLPDMVHLARLWWEARTYGRDS